MKNILKAITILLTIHSLAFSSDAFPVPKNYDNWISFWIKIFTEYSSNQIIIFDERCPEAIIAVLEINNDSNKKLINPTKKIASSDKENDSLSFLKNLIDENVKISYIQSLPQLNESLKKCGVKKTFSLNNAPLRFQKGNKDIIKYGIMRYGLYKDKIISILKEYDLPPEISYLPLLESNYWNYSYSKAGALGIWQFMPGTAKKYLLINKYKDERLDWIKSTHAAAKYLKSAHQEFGKWDIAITSYNHGMQGMRLATKQLNTTDLEIIFKEYKSKYFKFASKNFYLSFLAIKTIMESLDKYFPSINTLPPLNIKPYTITSPIKINTLISKLKIDKINFQIMNPSFTEFAYIHNITLQKDTIIYIHDTASHNQLTTLLSYKPFNPNKDINNILNSNEAYKDKIIALNSTSEKSFKKLKRKYLIIPIDYKIK
jgi:membrane-bound lytic murein transglycosylase D